MNSISMAKRINNIAQELADEFEFKTFTGHSRMKVYHIKRKEIEEKRDGEDRMPISNLSYN
jgi:hypothetical protein